MASVRKIIDLAEIYTKKVLLINLNNFVLGSENAVKACAEIDPKIDEGKWYEIKKRTNKTFKPSAIYTNIRLAFVSIKSLTQTF